MESHKNKRIPNFYSSQLITMNNNTFRNNIRRYILGDDEDTGMDIDIDIDKFEITKFDYRKIFDKRAIQNVSYQEILRKMFEIENVFDLDMDHVRSL